MRSMLGGLRADNQEFVHQLSFRVGVTGNSVPMKALRQQIKLMAPTNGRVLIYGESGTGKGTHRPGNARGIVTQGPRLRRTQLRRHP